MKNDTVMGIIGKTHGVRMAAKPQRMASRIIAQMFDFVPDAVIGSAASITAGSEP